MRNIIVPLDGSTVAERALRVAYAAAERAAARVTVIRVRVHGERDDADAYLASAVQRFVETAPTTTLTFAGSPVDRILAAGDEPDTVICMASHGRTGLRKLVLGSVADDIVRRSTNPVIVVGPGGATAPLQSERARMVVCTDGSAAADDVLPAAAEFAHAVGFSCDVVTVAPPDEDISLDPDVPAPRPRHQRAVDDCEQCCAALERRGVAATWQVLSGDPARAITHQADVSHASFIAMGTHGHSGLTAVTLGSTAAALVRHAPCPVLITRPVSR